MFKKILIPFLALIMVFSAFAATAHAATITITPGTEEFLFNPGDKDLFEEFKGMMPGDDRVQRVALENTLSDANVTVYMKAEVEEKDKDFLRWCKISVYGTKDEYSEAELIAENIASEEGALKNDIKLVTLAPGEKYFLIVRMVMDIQMSNDYAETAGMIHWIFSSEEEKITTTSTTKPDDTTKPAETTKPTTAPSRPTGTTATPTEKPTTTEPDTTKQGTNPFTGSSSMAAPAFAALALSGVTIIVLAKTKRKGEEENET